MKATVIFSDGSKRMAHNLDDTHERWLLRRAENNKDIADSLQNGVIIPCTESGMEVKQIRRHVSLMVRQRAALIEYRSRLTDGNKETRQRLQRGIDGIIAVINAEIESSRTLLRNDDTARQFGMNLWEYAGYLRDILAANNIEHKPARTWFREHGYDDVEFPSGKK